jgi:hypothetical protein
VTNKLHVRVPRGNASGSLLTTNVSTSAMDSINARVFGSQRICRDGWKYWPTRFSNDRALPT